MSTSIDLVVDTRSLHEIRYEFKTFLDYLQMQFMIIYILFVLLKYLFSLCVCDWVPMILRSAAWVASTILEIC